MEKSCACELQINPCQGECYFWFASFIGSSELKSKDDAARGPPKLMKGKYPAIEYEGFPSVGGLFNNGSYCYCSTLINFLLFTYC